MKLKLPPKVEYIITVLERHGHEAFAVGGCVRDAVLGREPQDWDITTSAKPEEVKACFRRTIDTGIQHGTVTVMLEDDGFEVTTYRVDGTYSDGRHPDRVTFTPNLRDDLMRRDFTINAMAYNDRAGLVDLYGGMHDLAEQIIRCVGDPEERFQEDALRILRAVRFAAVYGFRIDGETYRAISGHAERLRLVSAERIRVELVKTLNSLHPEFFEELYTLGITRVILPEFDVCMETPQNTPHHAFSVGQHIIRATCEVRGDEVLRLTMLLHDIGKPASRRTDPDGTDHFNGHAEVSARMADGILKRLKFDNETRKRVVNLVRWHDLRPEPDEISVRRAMVLIGPENFEDYLAVQWADNMAKSRFQIQEKQQRVKDVREVYRRIKERGDCLCIADLAVGGDDILKMGISGRRVGELLKAALEEVLADPAVNSREYLLHFLEKTASGTNN